MVLGPVYGLATLNVPPAGEPTKEIAVPAHPPTLPAVTVGFAKVVILAVALVAEHPFESVKEYVYVVLGPVYGLATLNVPPAGEPTKEIAVPAHPLTLPAVTVGFAKVVILAEALVAEHPLPSVKE